jgi:hypothetical protein
MSRKNNFGAIDKRVILSIIIVSIISGVGTYFLYKWYKKTKTPASKFGLNEKPN